jgi:hypothetical protein
LVGLAGYEAHTKFADESARLTADYFRTEVVTIHRTQEGLKMLSLYTQIFFEINCSLKTQVQQSFLQLHPIQKPTSLAAAGFHGLDVDSVNCSSDYFAYLCIPARETILHQKGMSISDRFHLHRQTVQTNSKNKPR